MATSHEIRHLNLLLLIKAAGSIQALADQVNKAHSQISQLRNRIAHSKTGNPREMGDALAREIEVKLGKPVGWMDQLHDDDASFVAPAQPAAPAPAPAPPTPDSDYVTLETMRYFTEEEKAFLRDVAEVRKRQGEINTNELRMRFAPPHNRRQGDVMRGGRSQFGNLQDETTPAVAQTPASKARKK